MSDSERIQELQIKVAFLEDSLAKLSDEYAVQQRELDVLKGALQSLNQRIQASTAQHDNQDQVADDKPPHY